MARRGARTKPSNGNVRPDSAEASKSKPLLQEIKANPSHISAPKAVDHLLDARKPREEEDFCRVWHSHRRRSFLHFTFGIFTLISASIILALFMAKDPVLQIWGTATYGMGTILSILGYLDRRRTALFESVVVFLFVMHAISNSATLYYVNHFGVPERDLIFVSANFFAIAVYAPLFIPTPFWRIASVIVFINLCCALAIYSLPLWPLFLVELTSTMIFSTVLRAFYESFQNAQARAEFRYRTQIAPAHVVRHAIVDNVSMEEIFKPEEKFCVCITSDWHDYRDLCERLSLQELTLALNSYYNLCQNLLDQAFPWGNYYTDWIADELFIVAYPVDTQSETAIVNGAVSFALQLLTARSQFTAKFRVPNQIDIGMAAGTALLGLMGPRGQTKVTALGVVPGRARRLQSSAQILRQQFVRRDRVVFDYECLRRLNRPFKVESYDLKDGEAIRDIPDRTLYYISAEIDSPLSEPTLAARVGL